ncbi:DUF6412 domain-containing protein [Kribbella shirazensis]|uniref:Uncharacterized protein n=1 Tax=Kribbella shirazensis TaxID=1105143 RepID=A0A7X5VGJ2_9ACTN|nr:DUF6412 domain-containing protein [Kribbella shirazensis]NIK59723.1 hypothetical protein [Kribbella shirazensis]
MTQWVAGVLAAVIPVFDTASLAAAVLTAAALLLALVVVARSAARSPLASPLPARASATRANARRTAYLSLRDPDAAGKPRPRAPGQ